MRRLIVILAVIGFLLAGCGETQLGGPTASDQRKQAIIDRSAAFDRAEHAVPTPRTVNFPLRRALSEMTSRQDEINHPWYVYILADTGNMIGYYVSKTVPVNACDFLSSTEDVWSRDTSNGLTSQKMTAPSLDGIYYGGAGAAGGCDAWFFFDAATNALIQIRGVNFFSADQPLRVAADPIKVKAKP